MHVEQHEVIEDARLDPEDLIDAAPVGLFATDAEGRCVSVNKRWCGITGLTSSQAEASGWVDALHPEDRERVAREWYTAATQNTPFVSEYRMQRPDGTVVWVLGQASAVPGGHVGTLTEIGDLVRTREELAKAGLMYHNIAKHSPAAAFVADEDGAVTFLGDMWTEVTGQSRDDALGEGWLEVIDPMDRPGVRLAYDKAVANCEPFRIEFRLAQSDTGEQWLECTARPVPAPNRSFTSYVGSVVDISINKKTESALRDHNHELKKLARQDGLTKLPNRFAFETDLARRIERAAYTQQPMALLYIDLDGFKSINDEMGHAAGDAVLVEFAARAQETIRPGDRVFRLGGDEFAVVVSDLTRPEDAEIVARTLVDVIERAIVYRGQALRVSGSIGVAISPGDADAADRLIRCADRAMYRAKEAGGGGVRFFSEATGERAKGRSQIRRDLHRAIDQHEFLIHYQPQVDLRTRAWIGGEALVRWQHPSQGLLSAGTFVEVAESSGLIVDIGEWVLSEVVGHSRAWTASGRAIRTSLNVSYRQLLDPGFIDRVEGILKRAPFDPSRTELELTETWAVQNLDLASERLKPLREMGFRIAIDDFGIGYSNLAALSRLEADTVKIDGSFISGIDQNEFHQTIAHALRLMAGRLGFDLVAEGVETEAECQWLLENGIFRAQGYLFAAPLPFHAFDSCLT